VRRSSNNCPHAEQEAIRARLGLDSLSTTIQEGFGERCPRQRIRRRCKHRRFGFYMSAASLVATIAGLAGLTLPFAFYTTMSSLVAVVANPLFFLPLVLGGGCGYFMARIRTQA